MRKSLVLRKPKFRKRDRDYPLTRFREFLESRLSPTVVPQYLAALRRMLGHLGEGEEGRQRTWQDADAVQAYVDTLATNPRRVFQCAFSQWLTFTGAAPLSGVSEREQRATIGALLNMLLGETRSGVGMIAYSLSAVPHVRWGQNDDGVWGLTRTDLRADTVHPPPPHMRSLGDLLRAHFKTRAGDPLVPVEPGSDEPMPASKLAKLLDNRVPEELVEAWEQKIKDDLVARSRTFQHKRTPVAVTPPADSTEVKAELTFERDAEYEDFELPEDGEPDDA